LYCGNFSIANFASDKLEKFNRIFPKGNIYCPLGARQ